MRKIILGVAVSLDSFIEGPNGEYDWCFTDQDYGMSDFFKNIDAIFMGRKSYDVSAAYEGQNPWKGVPTYVFSRTLTKAPPNVTLLNGDLIDEVSKIKRRPWKKHLAVWRRRPHSAIDEQRIGRRTLAFCSPHSARRREADVHWYKGGDQNEAYRKQNLRDGTGFS